MDAKEGIVDLKQPVRKKNLVEKIEGIPG